MHAVSIERFSIECLKTKTKTNYLPVKAMLHEAIFLATCNATFVALQVARNNSRVTPHFATAIVALRVARKVERPSTFRKVARQVACVSHPLNLQRNFVRMGQSELTFCKMSAT